jgi:hypothetical protein
MECGCFIRKENMSDLVKEYMQDIKQLGTSLALTVYQTSLASGAAVPVFHGSSDREIRILKAGSWVTPDKDTAWIMGLYYVGRTSPGTLTDKDLEEPYKFGTGLPKFKPHLVPEGQPSMYRTLVRLDQLMNGAIDNPWEWRIAVDLPVMTVASQSLWLA